MERIAQAPDEGRTDQFQRAAAEIQPQRAPAIIEKDFWVCWTPASSFRGATVLDDIMERCEGTRLLSQESPLIA